MRFAATIGMVFPGAAVRGINARIGGFLALVVLVIFRLQVETRHGDVLSLGALSGDREGFAGQSERVTRGFQVLDANSAGEVGSRDGSIDQSLTPEIQHESTLTSVNPSSHMNIRHSKVAFLFLTARTIPQYPIWTKFFEEADSRLYRWDEA